MKKDWKTYLVVLVTVLCIGIMSCNQALDKFTPAVLPPKAIAYVNADSNDYLSLWGITSLYDVKRLSAEVEIKHRDMKKEYERAMIDDTMEWADASKPLTISIEESQAVQDTFVDPSNPFSIGNLMVMAGLGGTGLIIGKRKFHKDGDIPPERYELDIQAAIEAGKKLAIDELASLHNAAKNAVEKA